MIKYTCGAGTPEEAETNCTHFIRGECTSSFCEYRRKKQTNADRVRGMNDNELATFINRIVICHHLRNEGHCEKCPIHPAKPCDTDGIAEWLKQPAE